VNNESYIEGLRYELGGAVQRGDKAHEKAVKAELDRASGREPEKAVQPAPAESRARAKK
jgi:hypothetical protein